MAKDESVYTQMIKIWVDDEREMPEGYDVHSKSVEDAIKEIIAAYATSTPMEVSLDHDAGCQAMNGGDYIEILNLLERYSHCRISWSRFVKNKMTFHLHTANPVRRKKHEKNYPEKWLEGSINEMQVLL